MTENDKGNIEGHKGEKTLYKGALKFVKEGHIWQM
jgi:hypothetical protein